VRRDLCAADAARRGEQSESDAPDPTTGRPDVTSDESDSDGPDPGGAPRSGRERGSGADEPPRVADRYAAFHLQDDSVVIYDCEESAAWVRATNAVTVGPAAEDADAPPPRGGPD
jgi:hypothetical protein